MTGPPGKTFHAHSSALWAWLILALLLSLALGCTALPPQPPVDPDTQTVPGESTLPIATVANPLSTANPDIPIELPTPSLGGAGYTTAHAIARCRRVCPNTLTSAHANTDS